MIRNYVLALILIPLFPNFCLAQCERISIAVSKKEACVPALMQFKVKNAPSGSNYNWNFGSGIISGTDSFDRIYENSGWIDIEVEVILKGGKKCLVKKSKIAYIRPEPRPQLQVSRKVVCATPDTITLLDKTPNSKNRTWNIEGQVIYAKSRKSTYTLSSTGKKSVTLMVEDSFGCRGIKVFADAVEAYAFPTLSISSSDTFGCVPKQIGFSAGLGKYQNDIQDVHWTFTGAKTESSIDLAPSKIEYDSSGKFGVDLNITYKNGCKQLILKSNFIQLEDTPQIELIHGTRLCAPASMIFRIKDSTLPGKYEWTFLNSISKDRIDSLGLYSKSVSYFDPGWKETALQYTWRGCTSRIKTDTAFKAITVTPLFESPNHYHCHLPFKVDLFNKSKASEKGTLEYLWGVYDSAGIVRPLSSTKNDTITISDSGYYSVYLEVKHVESGCKNSLFRENFIRADTIVIKANAVPDYACINQPVKIQNFTQESSYLSTNRFKWYLHSQSTDELLDSSHFHSPTFIADRPGAYRLRVNASNHVGCKGIKVMDSAIVVIKPELGFEGVPRVICEGSSMIVQDTSQPIEAKFTNRWEVKAPGNTLRSYDKILRLENMKPGKYGVTLISNIEGFCEDTVSKADYFLVNGIRAKVSVPSTSYCRTESFIPSIILENHNYLNNNKAVSVKWTAEPPQVVDISDPDELYPVFTLKQNGGVRLRAVFRNAAGCIDTAYSDTIWVGLRPQFELLDSAVCENTPIRLVNKSNGPINDYSVSISPFANVTLQTLKNDTFQVILDRKGEFTLSMIVGKSGICYDSSHHPVKIQSPDIDFDIIANKLTCVPAFQQFEVKGNFADTFFWDFGDGKKLKTTHWKVTNAYMRPTPYGDPYDVRLIAKHRTGCADTVFKKDVIHVKGPYAELNLDIASGCEPLEVTLNGKLERVAQVYLDYGDGTPFGAKLPSHHVYRNFTRTLPQEYQPRLLVVDSNQCQVVIPADTVVQVLPLPDVEIATNDSLGCVPFTTEMYGLSSEAKEIKWDVYDDSVGEGSSPKLKWTFGTAGDHTVRLYAENSFGCIADTARIFKAIELPEPKITSEGPYCAGKPIIFTDETEDSLGLDRKWIVPSRGNVVQSSDSQFSYSFPVRGEYEVVLELVYGNYCSKRKAYKVTITDGDDLNVPVIKMVSVESPGVISVDWEDETDVSERIVFEEKGGSDPYRYWVHIPSSQKPVLTYPLVYNSAHCFRAYKADSCFNQGDRSGAHCAIFLTARSFSHGSNLVSWTKYSGRAVSFYRLHRWEPDGTHTTKDFSAAQTSYNDNALCLLNYKYRVDAHFEGSEAIFSKSNEAEITPSWDYSQGKIDVRNVSVKDNSVEVRLTRANMKGGELTLLRKEGESSEWVEIQPNSVVFTDPDLQVGAHSYTYKAYQTDHCDVQYHGGNIAKTILLHGGYDNGTIKLNWNPYTAWPEGVEKYQIFYQDESKPTLEVSGHLNHVWFDNKWPDYPGVLCFRVKAIHPNRTYYSYSNEACVFGDSKVFIPTAFTPDGNKRNDRFKPHLEFVRDPATNPVHVYQFRVYNRWGEVVFETNDLSEGWDGMYKGNDCQEGVYLYHVHVQTGNGQNLDRHGTVQLFRTDPE